MRQHRRRTTGRYSKRRQFLCIRYMDKTIPVSCILKLPASSHLLWLYSPVYVRPGRKPGDRFSHDPTQMNFELFRSSKDTLWHEKMSVEPLIKYPYVTVFPPKEILQYQLSLGLQHPVYCYSNGKMIEGCSSFT